MCNAHSCFGNVTRDVHMCLCLCQSVSPNVCLCGCVIPNQSTSKSAHYVLNLSKLDALLHKTHMKVLLVLW